MARSLVVKSEWSGAEECRLTLLGSLVVETYDKLDTAIRQGFESGAKRLVIDLGEVEYISSTGVGVFIEALAMAETMDGTIVFENITPKARGILKLVGILDVAGDPVTEG